MVGKEAGREGRSTDIMAISFQLFNTERACRYVSLTLPHCYISTMYTNCVCMHTTHSKSICCEIGYWWSHFAHGFVTMFTGLYTVVSEYEHKVREINQEARDPPSP